MKAVILLGAPGAGKGTLASEMVRIGNYAHLSTGDLLRAAVADGTDIGRAAAAYMESGALVPDELVVRLVGEHMAHVGAPITHVFDGFPRTVEQADRLDDLLDAMNGSLKKVFQVDVARDVLVRRLAGRRVCRRCKAVFHVQNRPPAVEGRCDRCGGALMQREDDAEETVRHRLDVYEAQTAALVSHYRARGLLVELDGHRDPEEIAREVDGMLPAGVAGR